MTIRAEQSMTRKPRPIEQIEAQAFRRQQIAFSLLTMFVLAILLLLHALFATLLGEPSKAVILLLVAAFSLKVMEIIWLQGLSQGLTEKTARIETGISVVGILVLSALLALLTNRDVSPYFVLLAIPILQSAYHLQLGPTIATVAAAVGMIFAWNAHYYSVHPPPRPTEYLEAGMISVIYWLMGPLVWYLVNQVKQKETKLHEKVAELESARERLSAEEKLAAIGRLASGIAHEIRNPVAMITSALATATHPDSDTLERNEMLAIAAHEAKRLENLTGDFLTYARPARLERSLIAVDDILRHVADVTKMRAADRSIVVNGRYDAGTEVEVDPSQLEGALLNLTLNALDATPSGGTIEVRSSVRGNVASIEVENSGSKIPDDHLQRIFEPFFTTKPTGTGLGLAIARGVAIAHGGDLRISSNRDGAVVFTMTVVKAAATSHENEAQYGEDTCRR
jgi:signal transduction histidine kinase